MKFIWEAEDIRGGRRFGQPHPSDERWMIATLRGGFFMVSTVDGVVAGLTPGVSGIVPISAEQAADFLNKGGWIPAEHLPPSPKAYRGRKGGIARAASMSPEERSAVAKKAADKRWGNEDADNG